MVWSRRDKDGFRGVGPVCVRLWRRQKILWGQGGCNYKLFRCGREERGHSVFSWPRCLVLQLIKQLRGKGGGGKEYVCAGIFL